MTHKLKEIHQIMTSFLPSMVKRISKFLFIMFVWYNRKSAGNSDVLRILFVCCSIFCIEPLDFHLFCYHAMYYGKQTKEAVRVSVSW